MSPRLSGVWMAPLFCASLHAGSLTVNVKDPGQASVADAAVEVAAGDNVTQRQSTDTSGRATFEQLTAASYRVAVSKEGFASWEGSVRVGDRPVSLAIALKLLSLA